jgi:hypothetical protein
VGIAGNVGWEEFKGYEAVEASVLSLENNAHAATTEAFKDVVAGDGLSDVRDRRSGMVGKC